MERLYLNLIKRNPYVFAHLLIALAMTFFGLWGIQFLGNYSTFEMNWAIAGLVLFIGLLYEISQLRDGDGNLLDSFEDTIANIVGVVLGQSLYCYVI